VRGNNPVNSPANNPGTTQGIPQGTVADSILIGDSVLMITNLNDDYT